MNPMNARGRIARISLAATAAVLLQLALTMPAAAQSVTKLRLGTYLNEVDVRYQALKHFSDVLKAKTEGRVVVDIFGSSTLHPFDKAIDAVRGGISDISPITGGAIDQRLACARHTSIMPGSIDWQRHIEFDQEYLGLLKGEFARLNLIPLFAQNASYDQEWWFRKPIESLDKLEGRLIRSIGPSVTHIIERWGGKAVYIAPGEVYLSAERGVVDGINMGVATFSSLKLWNVMPYMVNADVLFAEVIYIMNAKMYERLAPKDRQALQDAVQETGRWLKPRYEAWVNEQVGRAVMQGGASARSLTPAERDRLIKSAGQGWVDRIPEVCGAELGKQMLELFAKYRP